MTLQEINEKCDQLRAAKDKAFMRFRGLQATADAANIEYIDARDALVAAENEWTKEAQAELSRREKR